MSIAKYGGWLVAGLLALNFYNSDDSDKRNTSDDYKRPPPSAPIIQKKVPATKTVSTSPRILKPTPLTATPSYTPPKKTTFPRLTQPKAASTPLVHKVMFVDASRLNVRNGPGKKHRTIWTVKRDEAVQVVSVSGKWKEIKGERFRGWVYGTYLTNQPSPSRQKPSKKNIAKKAVQMSTAAIKKLLIQRSHAYYTGNCPCPYNRNRAGRRCGGNSAYSKPGGAEPLCYPSDVSAAMVTDFRARQ